MPESGYAAVKAVHVACVGASYTLFVIRGVWMLRNAPLCSLRWARVVPHAVDSLLLASALVMVFMSGQYPFVAGWLTAKVLALCGYIALGSVALRHGRSRGARLAAWLAAQAVFLYIVAVALTRDPLAWRGLM